MKALKCIIAIPLLLFLSNVIGNAQNIALKTYCSAASEYANLDTLKRSLLINAKREAVNEIFGELITSFTKVESGIVSEANIKLTSAGFIRIRGNPLFRNGENFGEVCVSINAYATDEDKSKFEPLVISKKYCATDPKLTTRELKEFARKQAITSALVDYDRGLEIIPQNTLLKLVHQVKYIEEGFIPETESYCFKFEGIVYPIEVISLLSTKSISNTEILQEPSSLNGLVAYYPFNGNANDESGNSNNGTEKFGGANYVKGAKGQAMNFGGFNNPGHIRILNSSTLQFSDAISFSFWVKINTAVGMSGWGRYSPNGNHIVVAKDHDNPGGFYILVRMPSDNILESSFVNCISYHNSDVAVTGNTQYSLGDWLHIVYVISSSEGKLYYNGSLVTVSALTSKPNYSISNAKDLYFGKFKDQWYPLDGALDEFRIYDRVLHDNEIVQLHNECGRER